MDPLISIVVPTYNRAHLIGETLETIISQSYKNWECIVVDDGSMDYTKELLMFYCEKEQRIRYHICPKERQKGANACRNYGYELSEGEYIHWFDSDDLMHPELLERQINSLRNSGVDFSVCRMAVFSEEKSAKPHGKVYSDSPFQDYVTDEISFTTSNPLWKKVSLKRLPYLFDEELQAAQEWEFHCRALGHFLNYVVVDEILLYFRQHKNSISYGVKASERHKNYFLARLKIYSNEQLTLSQFLEEYLQNYLIDYFRGTVRNRSFRAGFFAFFSFLVWEERIDILNRIKGFISLLSYSLIGKGNFFLKDVKYQ